MAIIRNGCKKPLSIIKKARKAQAKHAIRATGNKCRLNKEIKLWNKQARQDRRWLRARVESADRGGISFEAERQLAKRFGYKSKQEQEVPSMKEGKKEALLPEAEQACARLRAERSEAMRAAGVSDYVEDWWVGQEVQGGEDDVGGLEVEMEALEIADGEEGEEEWVPTRDREHGNEGDDEGCEGFWGVETVLTIRGRGR